MNEVQLIRCTVCKNPLGYVGDTLPDIPFEDFGCAPDCSGHKGPKAKGVMHIAEVDPA